jgi:hypothetical protein
VSAYVLGEPRLPCLERGFLKKKQVWNLFPRCRGVKAWRRSTMIIDRKRKKQRKAAEAQTVSSSVQLQNQGLRFLHRVPDSSYPHEDPLRPFRTSLVHWQAPRSKTIQWDGEGQEGEEVNADTARSE